MFEDALSFFHLSSDRYQEERGLALLKQAMLFAYKAEYFTSRISKLDDYAATIHNFVDRALHTREDGEKILSQVRPDLFQKGNLSIQDIKRVVMIMSR